MHLQSVIRPECILIGSTADDKSLALCEIAQLAKKSALCRHISEETILEALQDRETLSATCLGNGIALPHCRLKGLSDFVVGLITNPAGVDFEADDGKPVHLIIFILSPYEQPDAHLRLLSTLSHALLDAEQVKAMAAAKTPQQLIRLLVAAAGQEIETLKAPDRNRLEIFVQEKSICRQIVEQLETMEGIVLSVSDKVTAAFERNGSPSRSASGAQSCSVITLIVERPLTNEVIRRVETVVGSLFECQGVLVAVQELAYCAGAI